MAAVTHEQVVDYLSNLNVLQLGELVSELEDKLATCRSGAIRDTGDARMYSTPPLRNRPS